MDLSDDAYKTCSICGKKRPRDLFWDSEKYDEVDDDVCSICAVGDYD